MEHVHADQELEPVQMPVRHVACHEPDCINKGAPFHDYEPAEVIVLCPVCKAAMQVIPTPVEPVAEPSDTVPADA